MPIVHRPLQHRSAGRLPPVSLLHAVTTLCLVVLWIEILAVPVRASTPTSAQPDPGGRATVPVDVLELLMVARLRPNSQGVPRLAIDAVPEQISSFVPPEARFVSGLEQDGQAVAVFDVLSSTDAVAIWALELERAGVLRRDLPRRGFIGDPLALPMTFCEGDAQVRFEAHSAGETPRLTEDDGAASATAGQGRLTISRGIRRARCNDPEPSPLESLVEADHSATSENPAVPFPLLRAPKGTAAHSGGAKRSERLEERGATLQGTTMTPYELVVHFTQQLEDGGWLSLNVVDLGSVAFETFNLQDQTGTAWFGLLLVSAGDQVVDERRASFTVERIDG